MQFETMIYIISICITMRTWLAKVMVGGYGLKWIGTISFLMWPTTLSIFFPPSSYSKICGGCMWTFFLFDPLEAWFLME
jgi:hypothetical protein